MAIAEQQRRPLIDRNASDLAFRMGQALQAKLIDRAKELAVNRHSEIVSLVDVEAAIAELDLVAICRTAG